MAIFQTVVLLWAAILASAEVVDKIYWTNFLTNEIMRANLADGSNVEQVHGPDDVSLPMGLVIHPGTCSMYWADASSKSIKQSHLDGTGVSTHLKLDEAPYVFWLAPGDDTLYWTQRNGKIFRLNLAIGGATMEARLVAMEELSSSYTGYYYDRLGIAVDRSQEPPEVYVSETEEWVIAKQKWNTEEDDKWWVEEWNNIWSPEGLTIDESTREIYWVDKGYRDIRKTTLENGDAGVEIVISGLISPRDMVLAGDKLYFSDWGWFGGSSSIVQADRTGKWRGWRIDLASKSGPSGLAILNASLVSGCFSAGAADADTTSAATEPPTTEIFFP